MTTTEQLRESLLEALESGRYEQTTGKMRKQKDGGRYCFCIMGVVCDIWRKLTGKGRWRDNGGFFLDTWNISAAYPPEQVLIDFGLRGNNGTIEGYILPKHETIFESLVTSNDGGATFAQIARFIRESPEQVWQD